MVNTNKIIGINVLSWYEKNKRSLPFRDTKNPYKIWLSEIMLQQTKVNTVLPYYNKWVKKFPSLRSLATVKLDELLKMWEGLGYYKRCINFYNAVKIVNKDYFSKIPKDKKTFLSLPGVGDYTASAVLSIAFDKSYPVLDGNVKRVGSRILGIRNHTKYNKKRLINFLESTIPNHSPGDFNQGMMDIGALICKPTKPLCPQCPINMHCNAYKAGCPERYPNKVIKKPIPHYNVVIGVIWRQNKFYIQKRNLNKMLGGLWEFPGGKINNGENLETTLKRKISEECGVSILIIKNAGFINHAFSHFTITLNCFFCKEKNPTLQENPNGKWISKTSIGEYSFPKANHKLFKHLESKNWYA